MSETTNLVGGGDEPTVETPRMNTGLIWGKNAPEHNLPRVKNNYEVKIIFFSYLRAFFQNSKTFMLIFALISRDVCP